jgi:hypothetical protein
MRAKAGNSVRQDRSERGAWEHPVAAGEVPPENRDQASEKD